MTAVVVEDIYAAVALAYDEALTSFFHALDRARVRYGWTTAQVGEALEHLADSEVRDAWDEHCS